MSTITIVREVVVNECYGGFGLSVAASVEIAKRHGFILVPHPEFRGYLVKEGTDQTVEELIPRDDPHLVAVVREMGKKASGSCADLCVRRVEIEIEFPDHDGYERVSVHGSAQ